MGNPSWETGWATTTQQDLRQGSQRPGAAVSPSERTMEKMTMEKITLLGSCRT